MNKEPGSVAQALPTGVMPNAYSDSMGKKLADMVALLKRAEFKDAFSLFYILRALYPCWPAWADFKF